MFTLKRLMYGRRFKVALIETHVTVLRYAHMQNYLTHGKPYDSKGDKRSNNCVREIN